MRRVAIAVVVIAVAGVAAVVIYAINTTGQEDLPGLSRGTPTPDTRNTKDAIAAKEELVSVDPDLGKVFDAISLGDVDGILRLVTWRQETCGMRRDVHCGNAAKGETVSVVDVGAEVSFFAPAEVLRPTLELALAGTPLDLRFASQSLEQSSVFYLGFDGSDVKGKALTPLADPSSDLTGVFITVDTSLAAPIVSIEPLTREPLLDVSAATRRGTAFGLEIQRLITFDDQY